MAEVSQRSGFDETRRGGEGGSITRREKNVQRVLGVPKISVTLMISAGNSSEELIVKIFSGANKDSMFANERRET